MASASKVGGEKREKGEKKCKIPAGTQSHPGGLPGGAGIKKKKVIDIHFNPQLTTCHPIFTPETREGAMKYQTDNERGQRGAGKVRGKGRKRGSVTKEERLNSPVWMTYSEKLRELEKP